MFAFVLGADERLQVNLARFVPHFRRLPGGALHRLQPQFIVPPDLVFLQRLPFQRDVRRVHHQHLRRLNIDHGSPASPHRQTTRATRDEWKQRLAAAGVRVFDPAPLLTARKGTARQYLTTDTHWTPDAMEHVAQQLAAFLNLPPSNATPPTLLPRELSGVGDIARMLKLPPDQQLYRPQKNHHPANHHRRHLVAPRSRRRRAGARRQLRKHLLAGGARLGRKRRLRGAPQRRARWSPARRHPAEQRRRLRHARDARERARPRPRSPRRQKTGDLAIRRPRAGVWKLETPRSAARHPRRIPLLHPRSGRAGADHRHGRSNVISATPRQRPVCRSRDGGASE
ncbi:MAG: hypothetical protein H0V56_04685, partial [Chthoniobacterales bacterium]|nr:hypothetical protein [Chthoniobacterales bacterium]